MSLDLARALESPDTDRPLTAAVVVGVKADGTVDVDLGAGRVVKGCRVLATYSPATGDVVEVVRRDPTSFLVLGAVRTSNVTTIPFSASLALAWDVRPAYQEGASSGSKTANVTETRSYRQWGGWGWDEPYQGAYYGYTSSGYYRGCYFYGTPFSSLVGKKATRLRITIRRASSGGTGGAEDVWIAPHAHASRPSGSPVWRASAVKVGSLSWGQSGTFDLPVSWGQGLIDGSIRGFGHIKDSTSVYSIYLSRSQDSTTGRLTLDWSN